MRLVNDDRPADGLMQVRRSDVSDVLGASQSRSVCQDHESLQPTAPTVMPGRATAPSEVA